MKIRSLPTTIGALAAAFALAVAAAPDDIAQIPLTVEYAVSPRIMLLVSADHALYYKAYTDWNDLNGDGTPDTAYKHSFTYYGYFDPTKCYEYVNARFEPKSIAADGYCSGYWAGNFLNWATMSRMDIVRKVLYGGYRSTDSATETVLERSFIPTDAHSFAKFYNGTDLAKLTPFSGTSIANGITLCNTTYVAAASTAVYSQNTSAAPLIRVAKGDFRYWAANERWQCTWYTEHGNNGSAPSASDIYKTSNNDPKSDTEGLKVGSNGPDYNARVKVCVSSLLGAEDCKRYPNGNYKPVGLLHTYGEDDQLLFGLMTRSFVKNKSGGVLRKTVGSFSNEVNLETDGTFKTTGTVATTGSIVATLNKLRIARYSYGTGDSGNNDGTYNAATSGGGDNCLWGLTSFTEGSQCSNWGNPLSEMYAESLRYFAGLSKTAAFNGDDTKYIPGLTSPTWADPLAAADANNPKEWCSHCSVIAINASEPSYDDAPVMTGLAGPPSAAATTTALGTYEGITGKSWLVGELAGGSGTDKNQLCTAKTVTALGSVLGACPSAPRLSGTYLLTGLAHWAHTNDIRSDLAGNQKVTTRAVTLLPAAPKLTIPVPNGAGSVSILPACRNTTPATPGNCAVVDFKVLAQDIAAGTGTVYVNWEDSEQGGDYDQDMKGTIRYAINSGQITVTTQVNRKSTDQKLGFGYVISGTTQDGFHVHSGINNFTYTDPTGVTGCSTTKSVCETSTSCSNCDVTVAASSYTYTLGTSTAGLLNEPLWYAAKYGAFADIDSDLKPQRKSEWDADGDNTPDGYFFASDPAELGPSLKRFLDVISATSSSASVATNSITLSQTTRIYQARYDSENWTGDLLAFPINADGSVGASVWSGKTRVGDQARSGTRRIVTANADSRKGVPFRWGDDVSNNADGIADAQKLDLRRVCPACTLETATVGQKRLDYLRGIKTDEVGSGGTLRTREYILGDLVNSEPLYVGAPYALYPDDLQASSYRAFVQAQKARDAMLYVGGNDGMLHAFAASDGTEVLGYVPRAVYPNLAQLTSLSYTHHYHVDAGPVAADAYLNGAWRTILVGGLGAGGAGIYAIDITDPAELKTSEAKASTRVLWDIAGTDTGFGNLGFTYSKPAVVRLPDSNFGGIWAVAFGNGYEGEENANLNDKASLYLVDASTGALLTEVLADAGPDNGLSSLAPVDYDGDARTDYIYAGDIKGNLWRFEPAGASAWKVSFEGVPLFRAGKPITARPEVMRHPLGGVMVLFGTGSYYRTVDRIPNPSSVNAFYGVWDRCDGTADIRPTHLLKQQIVSEVTAQNYIVRTSTANAIAWHTGAGKPSGGLLTTHLGWYLELVDPATGTGKGELAVTDPQLRGGRIIFTTMIPSTLTCDFGGDGWLMELNALDGKRSDRVVFDLNSDAIFGLADMTSVTQNGQTVAVAPSGKKSKVGIIQEPAIVGAGRLEHKYASGAQEAGIEETAESAADGNRGRRSWLQIQ